MNIKNRLKKLEKTTDGANVCECPNVRRYEWLMADLSEDSDTSELFQDSEPIPDVCPNCRKPIEKRQIILQLCDNTTKDRFPEEWNAGRDK